MGCGRAGRCAAHVWTGPRDRRAAVEGEGPWGPVHEDGRGRPRPPARPSMRRSDMRVRSCISACSV